MALTGDRPIARATPRTEGGLRAGAARARGRTRKRIQAAELSAELGAFAILSLHVDGVEGTAEAAPSESESPVTQVAHFYALRNRRQQALGDVEVQDAIQQLKCLVQPG